MAKALLRRGVYVAQWLSPDGEPVAFAVTSEHKLASDFVPVREDGNPHRVAEKLYRQLNAVDPIPTRGLKLLVGGRPI